MTSLREVLEAPVGDGTVPGAVALVARATVEMQAAGSVDVEGTAPMARDSIFRVASITKPIVAAAVMMLVEDGRIALDDPVAAWLPELASPVVVRTPASPVDDVVPAVRPITVLDLLTFRAGYGFPSDFSLPGRRPAVRRAEAGAAAAAGRRPRRTSGWRRCPGIPLLHQPGEAGCTTPAPTSSGVLIARVAGRPLPEFLAERLFEPLGMADTGFAVPAGKLDRFTSYYRAGPAGAAGAGRRPGRAVEQPARLPVRRRRPGLDRRRLVRLRPDAARRRHRRTAGGCCRRESVRQMTTDHLTPSQREAGGLFLEGQGWGFGGSVDVEAIDPWNVPGRYGWVGGTGTAAHVIPSTGDGRHPAHPGGAGRTDPARPDAGLRRYAAERLASPPPEGLWTAGCGSIASRM